MTVEYKKLPYFIKELDPATRLVTGIFAVHGNVDDGGDMSEPGSFVKRLSDGSRPRTRFLWNHRSWDPPIASIKNIREVMRVELPDKVIAWAPTATGGVEVTRKYYEGVELADWVFKAVQEGDVTEMSYAYQVHGYEIRTDDASKREVRILKDVEVYDISDVNWGMNPATAGVKNAAMLFSDVERFRALINELKEGRMLSASNREKVSGAVGAMETALTALNDLLSTSDGKGLPETGETLNERSARLASSLEEFASWVQTRKAVRDAEGRPLSGELRERLVKMATEIGTILDTTQPAVDQKVAMNEYLKFLQIQSQILWRTQ